MKHGYPFFSLCALASSSAFSQPTLDASNTAPVPDIAYVIQYADYQSPGTAGADQTWDLSSAVITETHTITFVVPDSTPNAADFPDATWAHEYDAPSGFDTYEQFNSSGINTLGSDLGGFQHIVYSDTRHDMDLPLTFNGSWSDSFQGDLVSVLGNGTISGTLTGEADGYGTLILPYGTFTNVLRVHTHTVTGQIIISPPPGTASTVTDDGYSFFKPGVPIGLAGTSQSTNVSDIGTTNSSGLTYLDQGSIGMEEARQHDIGIDLAPNPAANALSVVFGAAGHVRLSVIDGLGRTVMTDDLGARVPGVHRQELDVSGLSPGHYMLRLVTDDGQTGMRSFVVDRR